MPRRSRGQKACNQLPTQDLGSPEALLPAVPDDRTREQASGSSDAAPQRWEKVLWKKQPFPDTYTDATFLQYMVVNANVPTRYYWTVVFGSAAIAQQMSTVVAAAAVPALLLRQSINAPAVLVACCIILLLGYTICAALGDHLLGGSRARGCRQCALLTGGVYFLSPLLRTLTRTVSCDTVLTLTVMLLIAHLFVHDYNFVNSVTDRLTGTVSLSAAVLAAVLMASQMASDFDVFVQVLFSLEVFLLLPFPRRYIKAVSPAAHVATTAAMVAAAAALLAPLSAGLAALFLGSVAFVSLLCPACLVSIHKFKAHISGPWDEAVPQMPRQLSLPLPRRATATQ